MSVNCTICTHLNTVSSASTPGVSRQRKGKTQKNTVQMRHSCTISGRKPPQEPCASASSPSPSLMKRGLGGDAPDNCDNRYKFVQVLPYGCAYISPATNYNMRS